MPATRSFAATILSQLWRRNRTRVVRRVRGHRDTPWMRPYEEDLLRELLAALQPARSLEWGGGLSTLQFPALLPSGARWICIEHDSTWARTLGEMVTRNGVTVRHVPADAASFEGDGTAEEFANYLGAADAEAPFDFILIDGRARRAAVERAHRLIAPTGIVALHDANRAAYLTGTTAYQHQLLFQDARRVRKRPAGGVWLGGKERDPTTLLDVALHRRVWSFYSGMGRILA